jgi:hypothetical protein
MHGKAAVCLAALLIPVALTGAAGAAVKPSSSHTRYVSGRVSAPGYTVVVLGYNGRNALSTKQAFRVRAPDTKVTIQLISSHGVYAGPVVLGGTASRAILGLKAGANVGTIVVVPAKGYAHLARKLPARLVDGSRWAYAAHGVPIGNGRNFGLTVSRTKGSATGAGLDPAHVGVPNEFNIAVPGTRVLKALAPAAQKRTTARKAAECPPPPQPMLAGCTTSPGTTEPQGGSANLPGWLVSLDLPINLSVNADAAGVALADIDSVLEAHLVLGLINVPASAGLVELNCNGLSFCSPGGSGEAELASGAGSGAAPNVAFPAASVDPATGLGELVGPAAPAGLLSPGPNQLDGFTLLPNAPSGQVGSGDVITENVTSKGASTQVPTTLDFVFLTTPALSSYADTAGDSGNVVYPEPTTAGPDTALGTGRDPIKVAPGPNGDVVATLAFFRPQRLGISGAGEPQFMDIGHLNYTISAGLMQPGRSSGPCPLAAYADPSRSLAVTRGTNNFPTGVKEFGLLTDAAADQPASAANALSVTVDLTRCVGGALPAGQSVRVDIQAKTSSLPTDSTEQTLLVESTR